MKKLTVGECFAGIGGLGLGLERTGAFEVVWQIEIEPYAVKVLEKNFPKARRYGDITTINGSELERVDVICGGFPCQDTSYAGKRAGLEGKRSTLWGEMLRLICEVRPKWVVAENVPGLLSSDDGRFFGNILRDLASIGFDAEWGVLSAAGVGAPHLRKRVFILAYPMRGSGGAELGIKQGERPEVFDAGGAGNVADAEIHKRRVGDRDSQEDVSDPDSKRLEGKRTDGGTEGREDSERSIGLPSGTVRHTASERLPNGTEQPMGERGTEPELERSNWWSTECRLGLASHGLPDFLDCGGWECGVPRVVKGQKERSKRLKALGNAVVPAVAQRVGEMILRICGTQDNGPTK